MALTCFGRRIEVITGDKIFKLPPFTIELDITFDNSSNADVGTVKIYNLSQETIRNIKQKNEIIIRAGYVNGLMGSIFIGSVERVETVYEGTEVITTITLGESTDKWLVARINETWRAGIKASDVASDIIKRMGLKVGEIKLPINVTYSGGKTFSTAGMTALEEIAKDANAKLYVTKGLVYLRPETAGTQTAVLLSPTTGLVGSPQPVNDKEYDKVGEGFKIISFMNHLIITDAIIKLDSKTAKGFFRVTKGKYVSNDGDHVVDFEAVPYSA